jgi:hypothetical protein
MYQPSLAILHWPLAYLLEHAPLKQVLPSKALDNLKGLKQNSDIPPVITYTVLKPSRSADEFQNVEREDAVEVVYVKLTFKRAEGVYYSVESKKTGSRDACSVDGLVKKGDVKVEIPVVPSLDSALLVKEMSSRTFGEDVCGRKGEIDLKELFGGDIGRKRSGLDCGGVLVDLVVDEKVGYY